MLYPELDSALEDQRPGGAVLNNQRVRIFTLGRFGVLLPDPRGDRMAIWRTRQSRQLLKQLLSARSHQCQVEELIETLWPDHDRIRGREYLRRTVMHLRRALEPGRPRYSRSTLVLSDRELLWLAVKDDGDLSPGVWLDAKCFEVTAVNALHRLECGLNARELCEFAIGLYGGVYLPSDLYCDWAEACRLRYRLLWLTLLFRYAESEIRQKKFLQALLVLEKLVEDDPDNEAATYWMIAVQALVGQRREALRAYARLAKNLSQALGAHPSLRLRALHEAVRNGEALDLWISQGPVRDALVS